MINPRQTLALLLIPACLLCAACDETDTSSENNTETVIKCDDLPHSNLSECEVRLHDGRHINCLALTDSSYKGGLSCDWNHATKPETTTK